MARPTTLDYNQIKRDIEAKGVEVLSVDTSTGRLAIFYKCSKCGEISKMNYTNYQKGQNPDFLCKNCQKLNGPKMERIQNYFNENSLIISKIDSSDRHWRIYFPCPKCGKETSVLDDYVGKKKELTCPNCRSNTRIPTQDEIRQEFRARGSDLLSEYKNYCTPVKFKCSKCGDVGEITLAHFRNGVNTNLLCKKCSSVDTEGILKKTLAEKNSKLLGEFVNVETPVLVTCTQCQRPFKFHFGNYRYTKTNEAILCPVCYTMARRKSQDELVSEQRKSVDSYWNSYVKEFFNIPRCDWKNYHSHHINRFSLFTEYRTSITNGYPLLKEEHQGNSSFYHSEAGTDIVNWPDTVKLPYHTYDGFHFNDLNSKFIMEIINPASSMDRSELYKKKMENFARGIFYMPVFPEELATEPRRLLLYSMIRNRLVKDFPDIYQYTNSSVMRLYARDLKVVYVRKDLARNFFEMNHIYGAKGSQVYLGLVIPSSETLVCCMGFSKPRFNKDYEWELDRFATRFDVSVIGGASKIFSHFIEDNNPKNIMTFCDLRFSSADPEETIYAKLGFEFKGRTQPNYWYRDPKTNILQNRLSFQKSMLKDKLEKFDASMSEFQNMEMNGYVRIFDCGNYKYVWENSELN